jgi:flagellar basal-body rod protein FlgG
VLQGLYSAAAGMAAQQQRIDAVSNDVANVSTAGYKRQRLSFRDLAYAETPAGNGVRAGAGAAVSSAGRSQLAGALQQTGEPLDVAIEGEGFLTVRRPDGSQALTRHGALRVNADRQLVTVAGDRIQPPVTIPQDVDPASVSIAPDGAVSAQGRALGRLQVVDVPAPQGLLSDGESVFTLTQASGAARPAGGAVLRQGALEASNVDMADAMVDLMDAQRSYSLASKAIQTQDQLMEIANGVKR